MHGQIRLSSSKEAIRTTQNCIRKGERSCRLP
nr:MAG TPA: hypothetical protein [Caudoviricetes sp.]